MNVKRTTQTVQDDTKNEVSKIVIARPEGLIRFGLEIVEEICKAHNREIVVVNKDDKTQE